MAGNSEEITMLHYEMSRALADEHIRDLVAAAKRHELMAASRSGSGHVAGSTSTLRTVTARMMALLNGGLGARGNPTMTTATHAGPIGCST
jgi:hypothetical protein